MTYAAAAGIGVGVLGFVSGQQDRDAVSTANRQNIALTKEEIAERGRQFDITTGIGEERFGYGAGVDEKRYGFEALTSGERETSRREREAGINIAERERFDLLRGENIGRYDPYTEAGGAASKEQAALLGLGTPEEQAAAVSRFGDSPGQKFMRDRAQKNLLRSTAAIGGLGGGRVRTALVEQGVGFAAQDFDRQFGRLGSLAQRGKSSADSITGIGTGPRYLTTGTDLGVASTAYTPGAAYSPREFGGVPEAPAGVTKPADEATSDYTGIGDNMMEPAPEPKADFTTPSGITVQSAEVNKGGTTITGGYEMPEGLTQEQQAEVYREIIKNRKKSTSGRNLGDPNPTGSII